ncbi:hypothetical protein AMATHDRAFT_75289 [Amanita thiersii Skay4041]|uniref:Velvet domain-containing protein n=1 Tax=Amanita thiersii Skay4041 TaxID=703135 RepID=A0A2A9NRF4_9AGAR|nr:hypothetical protein AMATHDRAFT_75289 [Amanita thiersii Skay4041]
MDCSGDFRQISGSHLKSQPKSIGVPVTFITGKFAGCAVRTELHEIQKAKLGRKYAKVDRRPLDPPPIVLLKYFITKNAGARDESGTEVEDYQTISNVGVMCSLDLFPVPGSLFDPDDTAPSPQLGFNPSCVLPSSSRESELTYYPLHPFNTTPNPAEVPPFQIPRRQPMLKTITSEELPNDVIHRLHNHLVTESSKLTPALVGEKFVEPVLVDYMGKPSLMFVFGDLAVQREGTFILRYRAFDIRSTVAGPDSYPILAECYGGPFRVYSTRDFPGLQASTELTKSVARYGVRVTMRDSERKPKRRSVQRGDSPNQSSDEEESSEVNKGTTEEKGVNSTR